MGRTYSCACTHSVLPVMFCVRLGVTAALSSTKPCVGSRRKVAEYCFTRTKKDEGLAWPTRSALTAYKTKDSTPSRPMNTLDSNQINETTESACKSCENWVSAP